MNPVKASPLFDPAELIAQFRAVAARQGFRVESFGEIEGYPLLALTKRTAGRRPRIYLAAAIHGDEPAGPAALLRLLEEGFFDRRAVWLICPVLNPVGLSLGTRENRGGIDLNRDYRGGPKSVEISAHIRWLQRQPPFDLALCLHEDWETSGFYLYERNPDPRSTYATSIINAVSKVCPIELTELIDGRPGKDGIIRPPDDPQSYELWAEAVYLWVNHTPLCYTLETPSARPLVQRVEAQCAAVKTAIGCVIPAS